jgi:hypothetical protein
MSEKVGLETVEVCGAAADDLSQQRRRRHTFWQTPRVVRFKTLFQIIRKACAKFFLTPSAALLARLERLLVYMS